MEVNIDTTMLTLPKGSSTLRKRAELEEILPGLQSNIHERIKIEERVGYAAVATNENKELRLSRPFSIFNAEAKAIDTAISKTRNTIQSKRVILSDSLSCLTALDGMRKIYHPKVMRMMNQIREKEHLFLI
jgi:hypothetical protein